MIVIKEFVEKTGRSPFAAWFNHLDHMAAAKVTTAIYRLEQHNFSNVKNLGGGVLEYKIDFGPGYRLYFGREGNEWIILLCGGTKKQQSRDVKSARQKWAEYKQYKQK